MSGYGDPHNPSGHGYGYGGAPPPPQPYASQSPPQPYASQSPPQPYASQPPPYGQHPSPQHPYGQHPSPQHPYGQSPTTAPYGASHYGGAEGGKPPKENKPSYGGAYYGGAEGGAKPPKENNPSYYGGAYYGGAEGGAKPPKESNPSHYGGNYYGAAEGGSKPPKENNPSYYGGASHGYGPPSAPYPSSGSPFAAVLPSTFPPGTDPSMIACFQVADQDGSGLIDDKELQRALSSYNQSFSLRTVHLLMYLFTDSNSRKIGPKEFISLYYSLQSWREIFERFDRDRSGKIDTSELRDALYSLGFSVSPVVLDLLVSKFDKTGGHSKAIEYDNFIECCLTVKGLTEKFKAKDKALVGTATFTYEDFMLAVLPFLIA